MRDRMSNAIEVIAAEMWSLSQSDCMTWEELVRKNPETASHFRNKAFGLIHRAGLSSSASISTDRSFKDFLVSSGDSL